MKTWQQRHIVPSALGLATSQADEARDHQTSAGLQTYGDNWSVSCFEHLAHGKKIPKVATDWSEDRVGPEADGYDKNLRLCREPVVSHFTELPRLTDKC